MKPSFNTLNLNYLYPDPTPCDGPYPNQCAIRMSKALIAAGVRFDEYSEPTCKHGHARGAESLANWLWAKHLGRPKIFTEGAKAKKEINGKSGVVFFKDCFARVDGESPPRGDHIDVWTGSRARSYSDDGNKAKQVWFWEL